MLSATLREIDSAVRWERVLALWHRHVRLIIGGLILLVLSGAVFFYRYTHIIRTREEASARYTEALQLFRREKGAEAENILRILATSGPAPYNILAQFRLAGALAHTDASGAALMFDELTKNTDVDSTLRDAARMRLAFLRFEAASDLSAFEKELGHLLSPNNLWHSTAQELLGLLAWRIGNLDKAKMYFEAIQSDPQAPASLQKRASEFRELVMHSSQDQKNDSSLPTLQDTASEPSQSKKGS